MEQLNIAIIGGGSSSHTLIPLLSKAGHKVNVLTSRPEEWKNEITVHYQNEEGETLDSLKGFIENVSMDPKEIVPNADVIILCMPVYKYRVALNNIGPHINSDRKTYVGTIYGQAGFNWMVDELVKEYSLSNVVTFAFGLIPWICRTIEYGKIGVTYGCKDRNIAAVYPNNEFDFLEENLFDCMCFDWFGKGKVEQAENFISLTLSVDNQIIHTTRCYGVYLENKNGWSDIDSVTYFYKDYDDLSADILLKLDNDYTKVRKTIIDLYPEKNFDYMLDYLELERYTYGSDNQDIKESFVTSKTLAAIKTPVVEQNDGTYMLDKNHRFFFDDIYYGNCIIKSIASMIDIEVPMVDEILEWAESFLDTTILKNSKVDMSYFMTQEKFAVGIPESYGINDINAVID